MGGNGLIHKLASLMEDIDASVTPTSEINIHERIKGLAADDVERPVEFVAELMAFTFCESRTKDAGSAQPYFKPLATFSLEDGSVADVPNAKEISKEIISYWQRRASECHNPLLKARYLGLVWEFTKPVVGTRPAHTAGREYVRNLLLVAEKELDKYPTSIIAKLERALSVAISLGDPQLMADCKDSVIRYENYIAVDAKGGLWGFAFDLLIDNGKKLVTEAEEQEIVAQLQQRLDRLSSPGSDFEPDPWNSESAAERLATYYRARNSAEDVVRVLGSFESACKCIAEKADPIMGHSLYRRLHSVYMRFGLRAQADSVAVVLREVGPRLQQEMKEVSCKVEIPTESVLDHVKAVTDGTLDDATANVVMAYLPGRDNTQERVVSIAKDAAFLYHITRDVHDQRGRIVASVGPIDEDLEGHTVLQMVQDLNFSAPFLDAVLLRLVGRHHLTAALLADRVLRAPVFLPEHRPSIERGFSAYLGGDHVVAAHLFVTQIESAVRELLEIQGVAVMKQGRHGFILKSLHDLLSEDAVVSALGGDMVLYLRVLLTDQRGWNLRNNICHAIFPSAAYQKPLSDRLVHALLCLSLIRRADGEAQSDQLQQPS